MRWILGFLLAPIWMPPAMLISAFAGEQFYVRVSDWFFPPASSTIIPTK